MTTFSLVFLKTISVLLSVIVGFVAGKYSNVERDSIASLLFFFISPIVFFAIPTSVSISVSALSITLVTFTISTVLSITSYYVYGKYWQDHNRNILALSAGSANAGYFMLPIASALFDDYTLSLYIMALMGITLFESSIGFYICAKSFSSTKESIINVLKQPILNAFVLGCILSFSGFILPDFLDDFVYNMKGAYSILGMVMVGLGLSTLRKFEIDLKFTLAAFTSKFIAYPLVVNIFILVDRWFIGLYDANYYNALQLISTAPMAANTIVIASLQKFHPEKVATTVLLSLIFVLIYTPFMVSLFLGNLE